LIYDLFAVDEHIGGLGGGHYRAYALNHVTGKWYHFDDSHVTLAHPEEAVNANAYLLFYRRRSNSPLGGKTHHRIEEARTRATAIPSFSEEPQADTSSGSQAMKVDTQLPTPPDEETNFGGKGGSTNHPDGHGSNFAPNGVKSVLETLPYFLPEYSGFNTSYKMPSLGLSDDHDKPVPENHGDSKEISPFANDGYLGLSRGVTQSKGVDIDDHSDPLQIPGLLAFDNSQDNDEFPEPFHAFDYPDPPGNASPSSSNEAEVDPDDVDELDWGVQNSENEEFQIIAGTPPSDLPEESFDDVDSEQSQAAEK